VWENPLNDGSLTKSSNEHYEIVGGALRNCGGFRSSLCPIFSPINNCFYVNCILNTLGWSLISELNRTIGCYIVVVTTTVRVLAACLIMLTVMVEILPPYQQRELTVAVHNFASCWRLPVNCADVDRVLHDVPTL
jgi:hypothetical protein